MREWRIAPSLLRRTQDKNVSDDIVSRRLFLFFYLSAVDFFSFPITLKEKGLAFKSFFGVRTRERRVPLGRDILTSSTRQAKSASANTRRALAATREARVFQARGSQVEGTHSFTQRKPEYSRSFIYFLFPQGNAAVPPFLPYGTSISLRQSLRQKKPTLFPPLFTRKSWRISPLSSLSVASTI